MKARKINAEIANTINHWMHISEFIREPQNDRDYHKLSDILDALLDVIGENESHELMGLIDVISHMISMYDERQNYRIDSASGIDALKFFMEQHDLKQTDLPEIGSQGIVSEILSGKRQLNINQIRRLSNRFHVSPETFI